MIKTETNAVPENRTVELPRADLSAREALAIIRKYAVSATDRWQGSHLGSEGAAEKNGRLCPKVGAWSIAYKSPHGGDTIRASLRSFGHLRFEVSTHLIELPPYFSLDGEWLDSTDAAEIISGEPLALSMNENYSLYMVLQCVKDVGLFWEVTRDFYDRSTITSIKHQFAIEVARGEIALEFLRENRSGQIKSWRRNRLDNGEWEKIA